MIESKLTNLFLKYFNKSATQVERNELMELLNQAENDEQVKTLLTEAWQQFKSQRILFDDSKAENMIAKILQKQSINKPVPIIITYKKSFNWLQIAAAATILLFVSTGIYFWLNSKEALPTIAESKKNPFIPEKVIVPGGNKAVLTLSDGSSIVLDSTHQGTLAKQGNAKIIKLNKATLAYNASDENSAEVVYNTLSTPSGGQYELVLQDGTKVWLNASSSIHFPTTFTGKERKVTVTGEAYFEVAKNASMPFKVYIKDVEVQVLGTHFNIMAYDDEISMNTTLLEGSVKISKGSLNKMLVPGQESRISKTGDIKITKADTEEVMAWKNGWFQFNTYDIEKVMRQVSRWYNVEIVYEGKIPAGHFTGIVSRSNDILQVLKIMQAGGVHFKIEGRRIVVLSYTSQRGNE